MKRILILFGLLLLSAMSTSFQSTRLKESYYQNGFAIIMKGQKEVVLDDMTRVDIVTDTFAIEVDFAEKWSQGVGQALYYAEKLNKKAGILLVVNGRLDEKYVRRLMMVAINHNITVWLMDYNTDDWCKVSQYYEYSYFFK